MCNACAEKGRRSVTGKICNCLFHSNLRWDEDSAYIDESQNSKLVETWVYNQLSAIAETSLEYSISHYRDACKREIDFMVERSDGAMLGIAAGRCSHDQQH